MYLNHGLGAATPGVAAQITAAAPSYGIPPALALAVATRESGLNQAAVGNSGEIGVFQLMPGTAAQLGVNPSDLTENIDGGLSYLAQMYAQFGDWGTALEAYNGGAGNVQRGTISTAARNYSASVLAAAGLDSAAPVDGTGTAPQDYGAPADYAGAPMDSAVLQDGGAAVADSSVSVPLVVGLVALAGLVVWAAA